MKNHIRHAIIASFGLWASCPAPSSASQLSTNTTPVIFVTIAMMARTTASEDMLLSDIEARSLHSRLDGAGNGYVLCDGRATIDSFNYQPGTTNLSLAEVITVDAADEANSVALSDIQVVSSSNDQTADNPNGSLADTLGFIGDTYTPEAYVVQADGTKMTGGPDTVKGRHVAVIAFMNLYEDDPAVVRSYITSMIGVHGEFRLTVGAMVGGDTNTMSWAVVSTRAPAISKPPQLGVHNNTDGSLSVYVPIPPSSNAVYQIFGAPTPFGSWQPQGLLGPGAPVITIPRCLPPRDTFAPSFRAFERFQPSSKPYLTHIPSLLAGDFLYGSIRGLPVAHLDIFIQYGRHQSSRTARRDLTLTASIA
ncbi:MAG: hypothetical protein KGI59_02110 [Patescibacteria group bacterium]|nr:hypothetical protein [Patescibacteria group bacterium]MDE2172455.1 hypothetical protein [Patescibacteria group bacterium]